MQHHIRNAIKFGVPVVVGINVFSTDTDAEIELIQKKAVEAGAQAAVRCEHWARGGAGAADLAKAVTAASELKSDFKFLYPLELSIEDKIRKIAKDIYGAKDVVFEDKAKAKLVLYTKQVRFHTFKKIN